MKRIVVETVMTHSETFSHLGIEEACALCAVDSEFFHALVEEGIFESTVGDQQLHFTEIATLRKAARLHHDLGVNPPGIALVLELLDHMQSS